MLEFCDDFEDHPQIYERTMLRVTMSTTSFNPKEDDLEFTEKYFPGTEVDCWCYMLRKIAPKILNLPYYEEYRGNEVDITYDPVL